MFANKTHLNSPPLVNDASETVKKVIDLLAEGGSKLKNQYGKNELYSATIILGTSGVGKSTFALRLAGHDSELKSERKYPRYIIIKPNSNAISTHYTASATIFPELLHNKLTGAIYYDFPGFEDTRGAPHDIATTYFIKKVVDSIKLLKIVFLINYSSFSIDGGRNDFTKLIHHITQFIKNIDRLKDSMALIATKVPPDEPDVAVIQSIAEFMEEAKLSLSQKSNENDFSKDIRLIDIFLSQKGNSYPKIGISKYPDQEGFLSNITKLQENKKSIENIINELEFTEKKESDFGYFIPKQSLNEISSIINEVNQRMSTLIQKGGIEIQHYLSAKENELRDLNKLYSESNSVYDKLSSMQKAANNDAKESENCVRKLLDSAGSLNNTAVYQNLLSAVQYSSFSSFLHTVSDHSTIDSFQCTAGLDGAIKYSFNSMQWYFLLKQMFLQLSEYEVQKNIYSFNSCNTLHNIVADCVETGKYSTCSWSSFLQKCCPKFDYKANIQDMTMDEPKLNALLSIMDLTLKNAVFNISCELDKFTFKGQLVKITNVLNAIQDTCKGIQPKFIEIFALVKVFIDTNMNFTDHQVQLSIIAPIWDIQGDPKIILDGGPGKAHNSAVAQNGYKWRGRGNHGLPGLPGGRGHHGLPGLPGGTGGNFLGIGDTFINSERLTISVNGGPGGPGQNGGDGGIGGSGLDAYDDVTFGILEDIVGVGAPKSRFKIRKYRKVVEIIPPQSYHEIQLEGHTGVKGGNGGDGGKGGYGGNAGNVYFLSLSPFKTVNMRKELNKGDAGIGGCGGKGGIGGKHGNGLFITKPILIPIISSSKTTVLKEYTRASNGKDGIKGKNDANIQLPTQKMPFLNLSNTVNAYKSYAKEKLNHNVMESELLKFLHKLESNNDLAILECEENTNSSTLCNKIGKNAKMIGTPLQYVSKNNSHISNQHRRRRHVTNNSANHQDHINRVISENDQFQSSSANGIKSPIHNTIKFLRDIFKPLNLFHISNSMSKTFIEGGVQSVLRATKLINVYTTGNYAEHISSSAEFNGIETLTLADFIIRWVTKMKPYSQPDEYLINSFEVRVSVINIVEKFERMLSKHDLGVKGLEFDPVVLISALEKEVINGNYKNIGQILFQSVVNNSHYSSDIHFCNDISSKINDLMLGLKNEEN